MDNLLSGLLGAIIAVVLTEAFKLYFEIRKKRTQKKVLLKYLKDVLAPSLKIHLDNLVIAHDEIEAYPPLSINNYNANPILNSDIVKNIGFNDLYEITKDHVIHLSIIDLYHCIDFLKTRNGIFMSKNFLAECKEHYDLKNLVDLESRELHAKECLTIKDLKKKYMDEIDLKLGTTKATISTCNQIIFGLSK